MAPDAGFEPATNRLTADYSTAELIRNVYKKEFELYLKTFYLSIKISLNKILFDLNNHKII